MLTKENIKDIYKASPLQEGMYYHFFNDPKSSSYLEQFSYSIFGELKIDLIEKSLNELLKRHEILRTAFNHEKVGQVLQVVLKERKIDFDFVDLRSIKDKEEKDSVLAKHKHKDKCSPFDLNKDVLMRACVLQIDEYEYEFIWTHHHILLDGWSIGVLVSEYNEIYQSFLANRPYQLEDVKQYGIFINYLGKQKKDELRSYWAQYLDGYDRVAEIPQIKNETDGGYNKQKFVLKLDNKKSQELNQFALKYGITLSILLQTVWGVILSKYNNCRDVVFGTVVSGRPSDLDGSTAMVGLFINTIPIRIKYKKGETLIELLEKVQKEAAEGIPNHYFPLAEIQAENELKYELVNHLLIFENFPVAQQLEKITQNVNSNTDTNSQYVISKLEVSDQSNYDFNILISAENQINIQINYNLNKYSSAFILRMCGHIQNVIDQLLINASSVIDTIKVASNEELALIAAFNNTNEVYPSNETLISLFKKQAQITPEAIAVKFERIALNYKKLDKESDKLAFYLRTYLDVKPNDIVGIILDRSELAIIAMLAIQKAGGAYLPIDPLLPKDKIEFMVNDAEVRSLVICSKYLYNIDFFSGNLFAIDIEFDSLLEIDELQLQNKPTDLAYVIYTSGSTGKPKGVPIKHQAILNTQYWRRKYYGFDASYVTLQFASFAFDSSVNDIFSMLLWGGKLIVLSEEEKLNVFSIAQIIGEEKVTNFNVVPSFYRTVIDELEAEHENTLKVITLAGEKLTEDIVKKHFEKFPSVKIINEYGPTENSICSTACIIDNAGQPISIGSPIANTEVYILNDNFEILPVGVVGELCISGSGLSDGYLNRPELSSEKFIEHPFKAGERIYKTGDLGRWTSEGSIEFTGRRDNQVKIRGYRVELGEIEEVLLKHQDVKSAVVGIWEDNSRTQNLVAYVVAEEEFDKKKLAEFLSKQLPAYMVPAHFINIDAIPLTINGKIDRKALPDIEGKRNKKEFVPAENEFEEKLINIWEQTLERSPIGVTDNFFEFGGHSLKAIKMSAFIKKELKIRVSITEIFENPTIRELARSVFSTIETNDEELTATEEQEYYPVSHGQKGLYLKHKFKKEKTSFNMSKVMQVDNLNFEVFEKSITELINAHESLRTTFIEIDNDIKQKFADTSGYDHLVDFVQCTVEEEITLKDRIFGIINTPFNLNVGPLFNCKVFTFPTGKSIILWVIDHIISDALSINLIEKTFSDTYSAMLGKEGKMVLSRPSKFQFKDYAVWQVKYLTSSKAQNSIRYWKDCLEGDFPIMSFPVDSEAVVEQPYNTTYRETLQREATQHFRALNGDEMDSLYGVVFSAQPLKGKSYKYLIGGECHKKALALVDITNTSLFTVLTSGLNLFVYSVTKQKTITLGTPVSVREDANSFGIIGWFLDTMILRNTIKEQSTVEEMIEATAQNTAEALMHRSYPFEKILDELNISFDHIGKVFIHLLNFETADQNIKDFSPYHNETGTPTFDLNFTFAQYKNGIELVCDYRSEIFSKQTIELLVEKYITVLNNMADERTQTLNNILNAPETIQI